MNRKQPEKIQIVYHELGHLFLALLFFPEFPSSKLTIGRQFLSEDDRSKGWHGGITFNIHREHILNSLDQSDRYISILLAGICTQNLFLLDVRDFEERVNYFLFSPFENMDTRGGAPDVQFAKPFIQNNLKNLLKNDLDYIKEILSFNFNYLTNPIVWKAIKSFAEVILESEKSVLTNQEMYTIIRTLEFDQFLVHNKWDIINSRYPLI